MLMMCSRKRTKLSSRTTRLRPKIKNRTRMKRMKKTRRTSSAKMKPCKTSNKSQRTNRTKLLKMTRTKLVRLMLVAQIFSLKCPSNSKRDRIRSKLKSKNSKRDSMRTKIKTSSKSKSLKWSLMTLKTSKTINKSAQMIRTWAKQTNSFMTTSKLRWFKASLPLTRSMKMLTTKMMVSRSKTQMAKPMTCPWMKRQTRTKTMMLSCKKNRSKGLKLNSKRLALWSQNKKIKLRMMMTRTKIWTIKISKSKRWTLGTWLMSMMSILKAKLKPKWISIQMMSNLQHSKTRAKFSSSPRI